jgi:hypothetical protein
LKEKLPVEINPKKWGAHLHQSFNQKGIPLTKNEWRIRRLKNRHKGKRCFIIGNGPSLTTDDLDKLKDEITFASNKIYLAFESTDWRPTYYSVCDDLVALNNKDLIKKVDAIQIHSSVVKSIMEDEQNHWVRCLSQERDWNEWEKFCFSNNLLLGAAMGGSVVYFQMQLAFYMGIKEIVLIGTDYSFNYLDNGDRVLVSSGEKNHFHSEYRKKGEKWNYPNLEKQYGAFKKAKSVFEQRGGIVNASRSTKLDVFPCRSFDEMVESLSCS